MRLRIKGTKAEHSAAERVQHVIRRFLKACKAWHEANARATRVLENCMRIVIARRRMAKRAEERRVEARLRALCGKGKGPKSTSASTLMLARPQKPPEERAFQTQPFRNVRNSKTAKPAKGKKTAAPTAPRT